MSNLPEAPRRSPTGADIEWAVEQVCQALTGLRFGQICLHVQDGTAVYLERTEKLRLQRPAKTS